VHVRSGVLAPVIYNLEIRWRGVVSFTPRSLYSLGKQRMFPLDIRLDPFLNRSGYIGENRKLLPLLGIETRPGTILTELTRLPYCAWLRICIGKVSISAILTALMTPVHDLRLGYLV
jgi:hypothetical protein